MLRWRSRECEPTAVPPIPLSHIEWDRVIPSKRKETPAQVCLQGDASERVFSPSVVAPWFQPPFPAIWGFHHRRLWIAKTWPRFPVSPSELSLDSLIWKQKICSHPQATLIFFFFFCLVHDPDSFMIYDICIWDGIKFLQHAAIFYNILRRKWDNDLLICPYNAVSVLLVS